MIEGEKRPQETLKEYLYQETVRAKLKVNNREQAIDYVGELLLQAGKIEARYISAMKKVFEELGAYSVIAPGIVLLHARPEDGALSTGFALATLEIPLEFGNQENDPVDLVFAMCAIDHHGHVGLLAQLAELLSTPDFLAEIRKAGTDEALCSILHDQIDMLHEKNSPN